MKGLFTALAVILSASSFIALPTAAVAAPIPVCVPALPGGFVLGVTGYDLQPRSTGSQLDYVNVNQGSTDIRTLNKGYDWAWGINLGYVLPCTGNDVNLSYFNFDTNNTDQIRRDGLNSLTPAGNVFNFPLADPDGLHPKYADLAAARAEYDLNQLDLTVGQWINVGCRFTLHPAIGLRWLQLKRELDTNYTTSGTIYTTAMIVQTQNIAFIEKSRFNGVGPWAGVDAVYCLGCGFGLVEHFNTALIVGNIRTSTNAAVQQIIEVPGIVSDLVSDAINLNADSVNRIVPTIDMKLGINYTRPCKGSRLTLEAGWMFTQYFNALDRLHTVVSLENAAQGNQDNRVITSAVVTERSVCGVGLNGPYISLIVHI